MYTTWNPSAVSRRTRSCVRVTSLQVASTTLSPRARAASTTTGEMPCAVKITVPSLTWFRPFMRSVSLTSATPASSSSRVTCSLCTRYPSMVTGSVPPRSAPTRLAIRIASTTPWQYPRGVIRTTSINTSLRGGLGGKVELKARGRLAAAAGKQQPRVEQRTRQRADADLHARGQATGRHVSLQRAGDNQQKRGPHRQHHPSAGGCAERVAAPQCPRSQHCVAEHQSGTSGDDDDAQLDDAVGHDE